MTILTIFVEVTVGGKGFTCPYALRVDSPIDLDTAKDFIDVHIQQLFEALTEEAELQKP